MLIRWTDEALSAGSKPSTLRWLDDDDRGEADDEDEEKDATADVSTAVGKERKSSGAARPPVRRRRVRRVRAVDHHLVLANKHKMVYPNDKLFDPKEFFEHADPGAIELEGDAVSADADGEDEVDGDAGAEPATRPRPRSQIAPSKLNGIDEAGGSYYCTAGDKAVLKPYQARYEAANNHWESHWPDPKSISSNNWKLEQARFAFNSKKADRILRKNVLDESEYPGRELRERQLQLWQRQ
ncbi:hypothetical protein KCU95_g5380, partial [Aureobasidium melanogenum]